jgi:hypothetical protein
VPARAWGFKSPLRHGAIRRVLGSLRVLDRVTHAHAGPSVSAAIQWGCGNVKKSSGCPRVGRRVCGWHRGDPGNCMGEASKLASAYARTQTRQGTHRWTERPLWWLWRSKAQRNWWCRWCRWCRWCQRTLGAWRKRIDGAVRQCTPIGLGSRTFAVAERRGWIFQRYRLISSSLLNLR